MEQKEKIYKRRFLKTFCSLITYHLTQNFIKRVPLLFFIVIIFIAITLYKFNPFNDFFVSVFTCIANFLGVRNITDFHIQTIIKTIISSLTILVSLLSAIYVFTYREQKSVSPSASTNNHKNTLVILVIGLIIFNIVFGSLLISKYSELLKVKGYIPSLTITKQLFSKNLLLCLAIALLAYLIMGLIKYLFSSMSVDKMLEDSVKQTSISFDKVLFTYRSKLFKNLLFIRYKKLHYNIESVFQNLKFAAENNMNKEFKDNISSFTKVIKKFSQTTTKYNIKYNQIYLLKKDGSIFLDVYNSALRSNLSLISNLMKNQQYNKAREVVNLYFEMYISESKYKRAFQVNLNDYLDTIDTNDERQLKIFLDGLNRISEDLTLITYKFLLMKLINKNQIKNLTNLVYAYEKYLDKNSIHKMTLIVMLLQNLIKSIEISNYETTGFLVKFLLTNLPGKDINKGLIVLKKKNNSFETVFEEGESHEGISENAAYTIKINNETFDYCFKKACILLYGQHIYSIKNKLWFIKKWDENGTEIKLNKEFVKCDYSMYMITKTKAASSKYGLLFFEDEEVMQKVYQELSLSYPESNTVKEEVTLSDAITFFMDRLFTSKTKAKE